MHRVRPRLRWEDILWSIAKGAALVTFAMALAFVMLDWFQQDLPAKADGDDRVDLMFGLATLALMILSLTAAILAFVGWKALLDRAEEIAGQSVAELEKKHYLTLESGLKQIAGFVFWQFAVLPDEKNRGPDRSESEPIEEVTEPRFLELAISQTRQALRLLTEGMEVKAWRTDRSLNEKLWQVKNNLAYYLALDGDEVDAEEALGLAAELHQLGGSSRYTWLSTYYRVKMQFSADWDELEKVRAQMRKTLTEKDLPQKIKVHLQLYDEIFDGKSRGPTTRKLVFRLAKVEAQSAAGNETSASDENLEARFPLWTRIWKGLGR